MIDRRSLMMMATAILLGGSTYSQAQTSKDKAMTRAPKDCKNMNELRAEIDRVDKALIAVLAERITYIHRAAEIKAELNLPALIPARVEAVINNVKAEASLKGVDPVLAEKVWRDIVDWSVNFEHEMLKK